MATNKEIGDRIKFRREELNMTLMDVALRVGVASSTIQRYESGNVDKLKLPVLESIAKALSVNPEWLVFKSDQKNESSNSGAVIYNDEDLAVMKKFLDDCRAGKRNHMAIVAFDGDGVHMEKFDEHDSEIMQSFLNNLKENNIIKPQEDEDE